jgi:hypothetical protein
MAIIGTFVDGAYIGTYNAVGIGITEKGFDIIKTLKEEVIDESDQYGGSVLDYFYRGGNCQLRCDAKEYKAGSIAPFWPWGSLGQMRGNGTEIGARASAVAKSMILTAAANTPAAAVGVGPATLTAPGSVLAPGQSGTLTFSTSLRRVPIFLQLLPDEIAGVTRWFTTT